MTSDKTGSFKLALSFYFTTSHFDFTCSLHFSSVEIQKLGYINWSKKNIIIYSQQSSKYFFALSTIIRLLVQHYPNYGQCNISMFFFLSYVSKLSYLSELWKKIKNSKKKKIKHKVSDATKCLNPSHFYSLLWEHNHDSIVLLLPA